MMFGARLGFIPNHGLCLYSGRWNTPTPEVLRVTDGVNCLSRVLFWNVCPSKSCVKRWWCPLHLFYFYHRQRNDSISVSGALSHLQGKVFHIRAIKIPETLKLSYYNVIKASKRTWSQTIHGKRLRALCDSTTRVGVGVGVFGFCDCGFCNCRQSLAPNGNGSPHPRHDWYQICPANLSLSLTCRLVFIVPFNHYRSHAIIVSDTLHFSSLATSELNNTLSILRIKS